jgi:hypothetical protein
MDGLRTLVRPLRKKRGDNPAAPRYRLTGSRIGRRFTDSEDWPERDEAIRHEAIRFICFRMNEIDYQVIMSIGTPPESK